MKSEKDGERRRYTAHDTPEDDVIVVQLNLIHVVFLVGKCFHQPEAHVNQDEKYDRRSGRLILFVLYIFGVHLETVYDEYTLKSALHHRHHLDGE